MRKILLLNLIVICLSSCLDKNNTSEALQNAEKYKNNPDSVASYIYEIDNPDQLSDRDLADYYRLFVYTQFNSASSYSDEKIFSIPLHYYIKEKDIEKQYEMYILGGIYWLQRAQYDKSLIYLHEGYLLSKKKDNQSMLDRFCELLGGVNMEQKNHKKAIKYFKERITYNKNDKADIYYDLALNYAYEGQLDSVRKYMNLSIQSNSSSKEVIAHRLRNYANILYEKKSYSESIEQLKLAQTYTNSTALPNLYANLSLSNLAVKRVDSAKYYLYKAKRILKSKVEKKTPNYISYKNMIMALDAIISLKENKHISLFEIGYYNDSIARENINRQEIIKKQLTDKNRLETDVLKLKISRQRVYIFSFIIMIILGIVFILFFSYHRKKIGRLAEIEEKTETLQLLLDKAVKDQSNEVDDNFFKKILLQQLGIIRLIATNPTSQNQELLQQMTRISSNDVNVESLLVWDDLYPIIDSIYKGFYSKIIRMYNSVLLEKEIQLCCLLCAEFSTKEISVVTQQSVRTIYQRKTNIRQKLSMSEKGDIVKFLMELE